MNNEIVIKKRAEELKSHNEYFTLDEAVEVVEIIIEEEGLFFGHAEYYDFARAFSDLGNTWDNTRELVGYVSFDSSIRKKRDHVKNILNTPTLHLLSSGKWIGWRY